MAEQHSVEGTAFQNEAHDYRREANARTGYIRWHMADLPSVYTALMPYSFDAKELWAAEQAIRAQVVEDMRLLMSPWQKVGPMCTLLDFTTLSAHEKIGFGLRTSVQMGMPDAVKPGKDFNGNLWADHPEVREAQANQNRTAEAVAWEKFKEAELAERDASAAYVAAANGGDDAGKVGELEAKNNQAMAAREAAQAECQRLKVNRVAAVKIVR